MTRICKILTVLLFFIVTFNVQAQVNKDALDQNADQSQGNYASTNLNYLGGGGSLGMIQSAWKDPLQHMGEGQTRPGYTKYYWNPELVLPLRVREGMYTLINFPNWEIIENVYVGDANSFSAEINGPTSLLVYPKASSFVGVDTNMIVFGRSGNKYVFYVQSETFNTDRITNAIVDIEIVDDKNSNGYANSMGGNGGFSNGGGANLNSNNGNMRYTSNLQKEDWIQKIPVDPTQFRFDIEVYIPNPDDIIIAPERVWRDNIFTYIDLGEKSLTAVQRPIVTLIVERSETPVGFRAAGPNNRLIIVEGMGDMVLRSGKRIVCLKLRRSDADGLENAVYAKSNDWDIQNQYASQPAVAERNEQTNNDNVFDFYVEEPKEEKKGWFDSFFSSKSKQPQEKSVEEIIEEYNKSSTKSANVSNITDIPVAVPVVGAGIASNGDVYFDEQPGDEITLEEGQSEVIVPNYNKNNVAELISNPNIKEGAENQHIASQVTVNTAPQGDILMTAKTKEILSSFKRPGYNQRRDHSSISIELGTDENVNNLERLWSDISRNYPAVIGKYEPFYSVDTPADGQGRELFHLRVGPIHSLEDGDRICSQLGLNGIFCSVVRMQ